MARPSPPIGYPKPVPTLEPQQALFLLHSVCLPSLTNEHQLTTRVLEAIPLDKGDYRPDEVSKSALDLGWHLAAAEMFFMKSVCAGEFNPTANPRPESIHNSADLSNWYRTNFAAGLEAVTQLSGEQLAKVIDFRGMFQLPAVMYLDFLVHHSIHHRGQLSMYLRPMGAKVPSIYGESYDAAAARKALQQSA